MDTLKSIAGFAALCAIPWTALAIVKLIGG